MATSITDFLSPEGATLTDPGQLECALGEMWKRAAESAAGPQTTPPVSRVSVANLVVVAPAHTENELLQTLADLAPQYPTRSIILLIDTAAPPQPHTVRARVSALCHLPHPGEPQICAEQIILRCGPTQGDLDRTVLPLLEADVPLMAWWLLDTSLCHPLQTVLCRTADRFILDAGLPGLARLGGAGRCAVRELGWYRIGRWRELLAACFDPPRPERIEFLHAIDRVSVEHAPGEAATVDAIWLLAFLAGQLDWRDAFDAATDHRPRFLATDGRQIESQLLTGAPDHERIRSLTLQAASHTLSIRRCGQELCVTGLPAFNQSVNWPPLPSSQALADALVGRHIDRAFERAAPHAAAIAALVQNAPA